jgi:hypothetical protein
MVHRNSYSAKGLAALGFVRELQSEITSQIALDKLHSIEVTVLDNFIRLCTHPARKEKTMSASDVSVVLVHGAWADGSSWAKVIAPLAAAGVKAIAAVSAR